MRRWLSSKQLLPLLLLGAAGTLLSCATLSGRAEPPRISLAGLRVREVRSLEGIFDIELRVSNRSDKPLGIQGVDLELALDGQRLAQGVSGTSHEIAPYSSEIIVLTVYASVLDFARLTHRLLRAAAEQNLGERLQYSLEGHVRVTGQGLFNKVPFESKGEIDLAQLTGGDRPRSGR